MNKTHLHKSLGVAAMAIAFASALPAETCVWTGGGDGYTWNDDRNWDGGMKPGDGRADVVQLQVDVAGTAITNDIGAISIKNLQFLGSNSMTLSGPKLTLTGSDLLTQNASVVNCDLHFSNNLSMRCGDTSSYPQTTCEPTFNGNITVADGKTLYVTGYSGAQFNGTLTGRKAYLKNGTINYSKGKFHFNSPVSFKEISHYGADQSEFYFQTAGNHYEKFTSSYTRYWFMVANSMAPEGVISFDSSGALENYRGYFLGADQTINRFNDSTPPGAKTDAHWFAVSDDNRHVEVVARGTADGSSYVKLERNMGFTWAPTNSYTQEFIDRAHNIPGPLVVSNGTIKMSGTCSFNKVAQLTVRSGATFHHVSTAEEALRDMTLVTLEEGATFKVDTGASDPFTKSPMFVMGRGAKIEVADGVTVSVGDVQAPDGTFPATGTYTSGNAGWVSGEGTVNVTASGIVAWKRAADGDFNDSANWNGGVLPSAGDPAYITANGADYTVSLSSTPAANAGGLRLANDGVHTNVLAVSAAATFTGEKIDVSTGGRIEVNAGGTLNYAATAYNSQNFRVRDGGRVVVNGGYLSNDNLRGQIALSGSAGNEGVLTIHAGTCLVKNGYGGQGLAIYPGGMLEMDGGVLDFRPYTNDDRPLELAGGEMDVHGDAVMMVGDGRALHFGDGTANFSGNASVTSTYSTARFMISPRTATDVTMLVFTESSRIELGRSTGTYIDFDSPEGSKAILRHASSATSFAGAICAVGDRNGYGELQIESGRFHCGESGIRVGTCAARTVAAGDGVHPAGVVKVSGGVLSIDGSRAWQTSSYDGIVIGDGVIVENGTASTSLHKGTLEISGGVVSNSLGYVNVGIGKAKGVVRQTGGTFISLASGRPFTIGSFGGEGEWTMSGGTASAPSANLYVGGCTLSDWGNTSDNPIFSVESGSTGRLCIANGTFSVGLNAYIGKNGSGLVEFGTGGVFNVKGDIDIRSGGTVKFVFGPSGTGTVHSDGKLVVDDNARLIVDLSGYSGKPGRHRLVKTEGDLGQFNSANVEIVGQGFRNPVVLTCKDKTLWCSIVGGFVMSLR